jgi:hypothetical protein
VTSGVAVRARRVGERAVDSAAFRRTCGVVDGGAYEWVPEQDAVLADAHEFSSIVEGGQ